MRSATACSFWALLLSSIAWPAVALADPTLDPAAMLDTAPVIGPMNGNCLTPVAVASSSQTLVAWVCNLGGGIGGVAASRVSMDGKVLDTPPLSLGITYFDPSDPAAGRPAIASDGTDFLVVAPDRSGDLQVLFLAGVKANGSVVMTQGVHKQGASFAPAVVFDGTNYVLAWPEVTHGLTVQKVSPTFAAIGSSAVVKGGTGYAFASLAMGGGEFLLAYAKNGGDGIGAMRLGADLSVTDTTPLALSATSGNEGRPLFTSFASGEFLVSWADHFGSGSGYARVSTAGAVLDPGGVVYSKAGATAPQGSDFLMFDGKNVTTFSADATKTDAGAVPSALADSNPAVACIGASCLLAWADETYKAGTSDDEFPGEIFAARAGMAERLLVSTTPGNRQRAPAIGSNGDGFLVAWRDSRDAVVEGDLYAEIADAAGHPVGAAFRVATGLRDDPQTAVAFGGSSYVVAWAAGSPSNDAIYAARVDAAGDLLDASPLMLGPDAFQGIAAAGASSGAIVVWAGEAGVSAALVSGDAVTPLPPIAQGDDYAVGAASDGTNFLVAWVEASQVRAVRLDATGAPLDAVPIDLGPSPDDSVLVTYSGGSYVVVGDHRTALVDPATGAKQVFTSPELNYAAPAWAIAASGKSTVFLQSDGQNGLNDASFTYQRVGFDGTPLDLPSIQVPGQTIAEGANLPVAAAGNGNGDVLFAWDAPDFTLGARRIFVRHMKDDGTSTLGSTTSSSHASVGHGPSSATGMGAGASSSDAGSGGAATHAASTSAGGGAGGAAETPGASASGCGCRAAGDGSAPSWLAVAGLVAIASRRRRAARA